MGRRTGLAEDIRTGLTMNKAELTPVTGENKLDRMLFKKPVRQHIKEFACIIAIVLLLIGGYLALKGATLATTLSLVSAALVLLFFGYIFPKVLHPVWDSWMLMAHYLGIAVTALILSLTWVLLVIPTAMVLRVIRIKVMDMSFRSKAKTYWEDRKPESNDFKLLERQF